jgi:hypothetical protein
VKIRSFISGNAIGIIISLVVFSPISNALALTVTEQGKSDAVIVADENAPDSVQLAASQLQYYVEKVTGVKLPIQKEPVGDGKGVNIFIGESSFTKALGLGTDGLGSDGYKVVSRDNWLAIIGRDYNGNPISGLMNPWQYNEVYNPKLKIGAFGETGTLNGVCQFLEKYLGIRWYMPDEIGTVIPEMDYVKIPSLDYQVCPDFEYRYPWFCNFDESDTGSLWYKRVGFGGICPVQLQHSFRYFLKHKESHPEYFALIDGQRDFTNLSFIMGGGNLCLSNPDVAEQWAKDISVYFDEKPSQFFYPVAPGDGMKRICDCDKCQAQINPSMGGTGKYSDYIWSFVNKVAMAVAKKHPDKYVGCIAYEGYNMPPQKIEKLSPNTAVMICKQRARYSGKEYHTQMNKKIAEWKKKTDNIYIWEYYDVFYSNPPLRGFPISFVHATSEDLKHLKGISKGEFIEAEIVDKPGLMGEDNSGKTGSKFYYSGMRHLNLYVTAKLYWNADLDIDELLNEYYKKFYGPASQEMEAFWTKAEDIWMLKDDTEGEIGVAALEYPIEIYTKDKMNKLADHLQKALELTKNEPVFRKRIELIAGEFEYAHKQVLNERMSSTPDLSCPSVTGEIIIDGLLQEEVWGKMPSLDLVAIDGTPAKYTTDVYTAWDDEFWYLAFVNNEPEISKLNIRATKRDQNFSPGMWEDDSSEIFISPNPNDRGKYYQFIINAKGLIWDSSHGFSKIEGAGLSWNSRAKAATTIEKDRWILEVRIPFEDIGIAGPINGKTVAANLYRTRYCGSKAIYNCWSPVYSYTTPSRFGQVTFEK